MTDQEQELAKLRWALKTKENVIDQLQEAIRRLADQDATLSIKGGDVILTMDATLTAEEREAIELFASLNWTSIRWSAVEKHADTLRRLLERLTGPTSGT